MEWGIAEARQQISLQVISSTCRKMNSFLTSGYLNSLGQLFFPFKMKELPGGWKKAKCPLPKLWKQPNQSICSKCNWIQTSFQSFTLVRPSTDTTRSIKVKPQNSVQATRTMELEEASKICIFNRRTKAASFIPSWAGVEAITAYT